MPSEAASQNRSRLRDRPGRCRSCGNGLNPWGRCQRRACPLNFAAYLRDQRERLEVNLDAFAGNVRVATVTAPGSRLFPCVRRSRHACPGRACEVSIPDAITFNTKASANFRRLHGAALNRLRRDGHEFGLLARVWEFQRRGLLHIHPVVAYSTPEQREAGDRYCRHLSELASRYGFGFADRKVNVYSGNHAAGYLAKRLAETTIAAPNGLNIVYISPKLSAATDCTMRSLRLRRYHHRVEQDGGA